MFFRIINLFIRVIFRAARRAPEELPPAGARREVSFSRLSASNVSMQIKLCVAVRFNDTLLMNISIVIVMIKIILS